MKITRSEQKIAHCQNRDGRIVQPACEGNEPTKAVTFRFEGVNSNTWRLCNTCTERAERDRRERGYDVIVRDLG